MYVCTCFAAFLFLAFDSLRKAFGLGMVVVVVGWGGYTQGDLDLDLDLGLRHLEGSSEGRSSFTPFTLSR